MIAAQQTTIPVWDGVTVTTPALVNGYYEIYGGATLKGFNNLTVNNKKGRITADFALNENYVNYATWGITPPVNKWTATAANSKYSVLEIDGGGHTIYGLYMTMVSGKTTTDYLFPSSQLGTSFSLHDLKVKNFRVERLGYSGSPQWITLAITNKVSSIFNLIFEGVVYCTSGQYSQYGLFGSYLDGAGASTTRNWHSILLDIDYTGGYACGGFGVNAYAFTLKNSAVIGSVKGAWGTARTGAFLGSRYYTGNVATLINCWASAFVSSTNGTARSLTRSTSSVFTNCYSDHTKFITSTVQGIAKTTAEIKSQAFVDLLNANLPAGCTPWKLGTDNYPTLDF